MINLLFTLIFTEMSMIIILSFETPLRKLAIMGLDQLKRGRGPVMVKTIAGTILVVLMSSLYSMVKIKKQSVDGGGVSPTDQILMERHLLPTSLMGFSLFLALMIDRVHHYVRELCLNRKSMEAAKKNEREVFSLKAKLKQDDALILDLKAMIKQLESECERKAKEAKFAETSVQVLRNQSEGIFLDLKAKIKHLESECEKKAKEAKVAEANALALTKQSEGFIIEYDRLLEDNHSLRNQLQSIDQKLSRSDRKKNT